jgi:hypothetical protein
LDGFDWGKKLHFAGYYTSALLFSAFILWIIQILFLCIVPRNFALASLSVGLVTILADLCYALNVPNDLLIRFPNPENGITTLQLHFSYCFYSTLIIGKILYSNLNVNVSNYLGISNVIFGSIIYLMQRLTGYIFETSFSSHFDSIYFDQEQNICSSRAQQKSTSVAQSLKNLDLYAINSRKNADDNKSLTVNPSLRTLDRFCLSDESLDSVFTISKVTFF